MNKSVWNIRKVSSTKQRTYSSHCECMHLQLSGQVANGTFSANNNNAPDEKERNKIKKNKREWNVETQA